MFDIERLAGCYYRDFDDYACELGLPFVDRCRTDVVLAVQVGDLGAGIQFTGGNPPEK